jgi:hypothetical protein
MNCDIQENRELEKISKLFSQAIVEDYYKRRYGLKNCNVTIDYNRAYDLLNLYTRALERDNCNICDDSYCCTTQLEERIKTL